jgi:hypothetical protein
MTIYKLILHHLLILSKNYNITYTLKSKLNNLIILNIPDLTLFTINQTGLHIVSKLDE